MAAIATATVFSSCTKDSETTPTGKDLNSLSNQGLGAQTNAGGSYYSISEAKGYLAVDAKDNVGKIDFTYAFLASGPTLLSWKERGNASTGLQAAIPADARAAYFKASALTPAKFLAITKDNAADFTSTTVSSSSPQQIVVAADKVYEVLTADSKKGLILVKSITTGTDGALVIDLKITK